jgi:hypothetical protein
MKSSMNQIINIAESLSSRFDQIDRISGLEDKVDALEQSGKKE